MHVDTRAIQSIRHFEHGAVVPPVHLASTFEMDAETVSGPFAYQRGSNPTRAHVETVIAAIEEAEYGFAFSTGMAATTSIFSLLSTGQEVLLPAGVYGGTYRYVDKYFAKAGLRARFFEDLGELSDEDFGENTAMVFVETPGNPTLRIVDIQRAADLAHRHGALLVVDNTFMTGVLQRPLDLGADAVVQSATKYLGGHSDLLAGAVTTNRADIAEQIALNQKAYGGVLDPLTSFRLLQAIKTLPLRLERQQSNAVALAEHLRSHPGIARVLTAGSHSEREAAIHAAQASGPGAVLTFELADGLDTVTFLESLELAAFAVSLGGVESLICQPATMTHEAMSQEARDRAGISDRLLRFSTGIEHISDLVADLDQALERAAFGGSAR
ncbi:MAG: PLP-dependent aspartate aminotransferase family protein [Dermabacter sp.]|nr:PLP-dependent aspartate aminotransferase family protein [Dermabacter sp.]